MSEIQRDLVKPRWLPRVSSKFVQFAPCPFEGHGSVNDFLKRTGKYLPLIVLKYNSALLAAKLWQSTCGQIQEGKRYQYYLDRNNSAADCVVWLKFGIEFDHMAPDTPPALQTFEVKRPNVKVTAWRNVLAVNTL